MQISRGKNIGNNACPVCTRKRRFVKGKKKQRRMSVSVALDIESQPLHKRGRQIGPGGCKRRNYRRR